jgi:hypothetical protein
MTVASHGRQYHQSFYPLFSNLNLQALVMRVTNEYQVKQVRGQQYSFYSDCRTESRRIVELSIDFLKRGSLVAENEDGLRPNGHRQSSR